MKQIDALKELAEKVEAGEPRTMCDFTQFHYNEAGASFRRPLQIYGWSDGIAIEAFDGSLDAAHSLHESVLPHYDWDFENFTLSGDVLLKRGRPLERVYGFADMNPARAWLLAIIKAKIAELE